MLIMKAINIIYCLQNGTEIENAFIYVTEQPMQTLQLQLQLQLQLFNNTTRDGHFQLKPQAIDLPSEWLVDDALTVKVKISSDHRLSTSTKNQLMM